MSGKLAVFVLALLSCASFSGAQSSKPLLDPGAVIDWSQAGVGPIPARTTLCARLKPPSSSLEINAALRSCPSGQTVLLEPGRFAVDVALMVPSDVTLRGSGADQTILDARGRGQDYVVSLGSRRVRYLPVRIASGAESAGSQSLKLAAPAHIAVGHFLVIGESNDPDLVDPNGVDGLCRWCDAEWTSNSQFARGQIVKVTAVEGDRITFTPALYSAYTHAPFVVPFVMSAQRAGVEDLQIYANNTGYGSSFGMNSCAYCWIKGVASNYTDGDHAEILWGFHDEIRDSYFSNAYTHRGGPHDADLRLSDKTTATLVENNILDRTHAAILFSFGPSGNVVAYNYTTGEFDSQATNLVTGGIVFHAAHPQFNLLEGNVTPQIYLDAIWGSSSHATIFRNWILGANQVCQPLTGRASVSCLGAKAARPFSEARALQIAVSSKWNNVLGNVLGSEQQARLTGWSGRFLPVTAIAEYPAHRSWDAVAYNLTLGYGGDSDEGPESKCPASLPVCHAAQSGKTQFLHGNFFSADGSLRWAPGRPHALPASLYRSAPPEWWGSLPYPAIGPDVTGGEGPGGHSYGNPAQRCYLRVMHGAEGGPGSPLPFNAARCYAQRHGL